MQVSWGSLQEKQSIHFMKYGNMHSHTLSTKDSNMTITPLVFIQPQSR